MRRPTLSPSKLTTYLACPAKYKWTYIDARGKWYLRARGHFSFGTTLHKVLQRFHDSGDSGVETTSQAVAAVEESWIDAGYRSAQEMQEALGEGKAIIEAYVENFKQVPTMGKTLFVEKRIRVSLGEFDLLGIVDRIDELPDGSLEIIDYKSGRSTVTDDEVATDLAMCCYQLMVSKQFEGRPVKASIIALRSGDKGTAAMSPEELEEFESDLVSLGGEILNRDYEALLPAHKDRLCPTCDFVALCRQHPDWSEPVSMDSATPTD